MDFKIKTIFGADSARYLRFVTFLWIFETETRELMIRHLLDYIMVHHKH